MPGELTVHRGGQVVTREELKAYPAPEPTETWKPVPHSQLVETLVEVMQDRGLFVEREQYAVHGARLFAVLDLQWQKMEEYGACIGLRHANDKSMPITIAVGARVWLCDNLSYSGEMITVRKHTAKLDLGVELDSAMYRYMQGFRKLQDDIQIQKDTVLEDRRVKNLIYDIFTQRIVPLRMFPLVTEHYAHMRQDHKDNPDMFTGWWLQNSFTAHIKDMAPAPAFRATARLGRFFSSKF